MVGVYRRSCLSLATYLDLELFSPEKLVPIVIVLCVVAAVALLYIRARSDCMVLSSVAEA